VLLLPMHLLWMQVLLPVLVVLALRRGCCYAVMHHKKLEQLKL
jgi:hypothetical protein